MERVCEAEADAASAHPTIMSLVIDGMDQQHCHCPRIGTQNTFFKPLHQGITGVKRHGSHVTLYRSVETVSKGANFVIYCVLDKLEMWKKKYGRFPEKIYLQVDGGSENSST